MATPDEIRESELGNKAKSLGCCLRRSPSTDVWAADYGCFLVYETLGRDQELETEQEIIPEVMPQVFTFDETIPSAEARPFKTHEAQHAEKNAHRITFTPITPITTLMCSTILGIVDPGTRQSHQERYFSPGRHPDALRHTVSRGSSHGPVRGEVPHGVNLKRGDAARGPPLTSGPSASGSGAAPRLLRPPREAAGSTSTLRFEQRLTPG